MTITFEVIRDVVPEHTDVRVDGSTMHWQSKDLVMARWPDGFNLWTSAISGELVGDETSRPLLIQICEDLRTAWEAK